MDELLVAAGIAVVLIVAMAGAVWFLMARCLRNRRGRTTTTHLFRGQGEAVTVAELLEEAAERGEPVRLNWPEGDLDEADRMRPYVQDHFPTAILPKIDDFDEL